MVNKKFGTLRLPETLIDELKVWKRAYEKSYNAPVTYEFMLRSMLDSLQEGEPGVLGEMEKMLEEDPSLLEKMGKYNYVKK